jgi:hypothetical protein
MAASYQANSRKLGWQTEHTLHQIDYFKATAKDTLLKVDCKFKMASGKSFEKFSKIFIKFTRCYSKFMGRGAQNTAPLPSRKTEELANIN